MASYLENIISELELEKTKFNNRINTLHEEFIQNNLIAPEFINNVDVIYKNRKSEGYAYQVYQNNSTEENVKHIRMTRKCTELRDKIEYLHIELELLEDYEIELTYALEDNLNYYDDEDEYEYTNNEEKIEVELDPEIVEVANIMVEFKNQENKKKELLQKQKEKEEHGFCRYEKANKIMEYLNKISNEPLREQKIKYVRKLFKYIAEPSTKKFISKSGSFVKTIKSKLMELRDEENLKESRVWWRNIFDERMPVSLD